MMIKFKLQIILIILVAALGYGLYHMIQKNGKLEKENENLSESIKDHKSAVENLGKVVTDLTIKYSQATSNEFKKFKQSDINKVPIDDLVNSFNDSTTIVLKDFENRTSKFIRGNTKTASP